MIKRLAFFICLLPLLIAPGGAEPVSQHLPLPWTKLDEIYYTPSQARLYGYNTCADALPYNAIYMDTGFAGACGPTQQLVWRTVDLTPFGVASDASAAYLAALIVVTPYASGTADIWVGLRRFGSTEDPNCERRIWQGTTGFPSSMGTQVRSPAGSWVPLSEGKFQYCYRIPNAINASFAVIASVQAWGRATTQPLGLVTSSITPTKAKPKKKPAPKPQSACKAILGSLCPE